MKFVELELFTHDLDAELIFYTETLGFKLLRSSADSFTVEIGWSNLIFTKSEDKHAYHYCFLIPSNQLTKALSWMEQRVDIIQIEGDRQVQNFESWNADSFYFLDASGNLAEFIARHNLDYKEDDSFDISNVLCVNEIGMPTKDIEKVNEQLENQLKTSFWKGDRARFGTHGSQEGLFLLPNYEYKKIWFPTSIDIEPEPFNALVQNNGSTYEVTYKNEQLKISAKD